MRNEIKIHKFHSKHWFIFRLNEKSETGKKMKLEKNQLKKEQVIIFFFL